MLENIELKALNKNYKFLHFTVFTSVMKLNLAGLSGGGQGARCVPHYRK